jgi:hypothetical protein
VCHCIDSPDPYKTPVIPKVWNFLKRNSDEYREQSTENLVRFSGADLNPAFVVFVLKNVLISVLFIVELPDQRV